MGGNEATDLVRISDHRIGVEYDVDLAIATGASRYEKKWKNRSLKWSQLLARLRQSQGSGETHAEYMRMPRQEQDRIKDIGGFVGGHLKEGIRKNGKVACRQVITLDADFAPGDLWEELAEKMLDEPILAHACAVYSTHKHSADRPRLRLIVPLSREATPDEYEATARKLAELIGIDYFDDSTYQPARLMYWPSHSADVEPVFEYFDAPVLDPAEVLGLYRDWTDVSYWPTSSRVSAAQRKLAEKQGDPLEKKGIVGAFCRTYTVVEAIQTFLPGVYTPTAKPDRWTYTAGSTAGGLVIYDEGRYAYSNHSTDPISGQLCNAFDLVRIHRFGDQDEGFEDKSGKSLPSYKAMAELASEDPETKLTIVRESKQGAAEDFAEPAEDEDWKRKLHVSEKGVSPDSWNAELIITHDDHLQGIRYNEMDRRIDPKDVPWDRPEAPWRDADDAQLYQWIVREYGVQFPKEKFTTALTAVADRRRFNPVREYLEGLPAWDGVERLDGLLIRYLGAEDSVYTRETIRKSLTAAVTRIYHPGTKFDTVLVLQGPQGIGKSMLFDRLGGKWFSDALSVSDMRDKTAAEKLQGYWIVEIGEMTGMRKTEAEAVKSFISRRDDIYRAAYGRNVESRPRQCVIVGSTNEEDGFLRDVTGNRRFWPVKVTGESELSPWDLTPEDVDQIWAEAKIGYELGEDLLLSKDAQAAAEIAQREAMETDERQGLVEAYLDRLLPETWDEMDADQRMMFLESEDEGTVQRRTVTNIEIWTEALGNPPKAMEPKDARAISAMMARIPGWRKTGARKRVGPYGLQRLYQRCDK